MAKHLCRYFIIGSALMLLSAASLTAQDSGWTPELIMSTLTLLFALGLIENEGYKVMLRKRDDFTQLHLF